MGDIFDQAAKVKPAAGGDIFDQAAAASTALPPNAGLAPAAGAPPPKGTLRTGENNDYLTGSDEGPIAQGLTSFETKLANMQPPAAPAAAGAGSYGSAITMAHPEMQPPTADIKNLNPIVTSEGSLPRNIGATAANLLPFAIDPAGGGLAESPLMNIIKAAAPASTVEAGKLFQPIETAAAKVPVDTAAARAIADEAQRYAKTGATLPPVLKKFLARTEPTPATFPYPAEPAPAVLYPEGRLFGQNASRLSAADTLAATPNMQRLVGQFSDALRTANRAAAEKVGMGEAYDTAMKTYNSAAKRRDLMNNLAEYAKGAVAKAAIAGAVGAGGVAAYKAIK